MNLIKIKADDDSDILPFIDLFGLHYEQRSSAAEFYNQFRYLVSASLKKKGDIITWMNNSVLLIDEQLSPTFEELILAVVLGLIDNRLPGHVKSHYQPLLGKSKSLMDYKTDILAKVPTFLKEDLSRCVV
jgi:hypothetical protein